MPELKNTVTFSVMIVGIVVAMLLGDYLGYKIGRWRLATIIGIVALVTIIGVWLYSALVLI